MCEKYQYRIEINNKLKGYKYEFNEFPELNIIYESGYVNSYDNIMLLTLNINGEITILTKDDKNKGIIKQIDEYMIQGVSNFTDNKLNYYMIISIEKCIKQYNLGQPFILEFDENPSTGYKINIKVSHGISLMHDVYSNNCETGITGCGGKRTFVLKGTQKGIQYIYKTFGRHWEPETISKKIYKVKII